MYVHWFVTPVCVDFAHCEATVVRAASRHIRLQLVDFASQVWAIRWH